MKVFIVNTSDIEGGAAPRSFQASSLFTESGDGQQRGNAFYYFSRYNHVWGWTSWRRAWSKRDMNIQFWPNWKNSPDWTSRLPDKVERKYWGDLDRMHRNEIDAWDYPWTASIWFNGGLTATPNAWP